MAKRKPWVKKDRSNIVPGKHVKDAGRWRSVVDDINFLHGTGRYSFTDIAHKMGYSRKGGGSGLHFVLNGTNMPKGRKIERLRALANVERMKAGNGATTIHPNGGRRGVVTTAHTNARQNRHQMTKPNGSTSRVAVLEHLGAALTHTEQARQHIADALATAPMLVREGLSRVGVLLDEALTYMRT